MIGGQGVTSYRAGNFGVVRDDGVIAAAIDEIAIGDGGTARITMTTTTPGCPAADFLMSAVQAAVQKVDGVQHVDLRLTYEPPWTAEMASEEARLRFNGGGSLIGYASHTSR